MSRFLANPTSNRFARRQIRRRHSRFGRGMMRDLPRESLPPYSAWYSENWRLYDDRPAEVRAGTYRIASTQLPTLATGISMSKSGTTVTVTSGYSLTADNVGDYLVWPDGDGENEYITSVNVGAQTCEVTSSSTHDATALGKIRQEINAAIWDSKNSKHVILIGTKVYYAAWNVASWSEAYCVAATAPANAKSVMRQKGDNIYLWNDNGIYRIEMGLTVPIVSRLNNDTLEPTIGDVAQAVDYDYGRRYTVTMVERSGNALNARPAPQSDDTVQESCPFAFDSVTNRDYAEVWQEKPFGPGDETYGLLTGGTLDASRDTPAEWESITDGQVKFTANDETHNIVVDFSGCEAWSDVADRIQVALRDVWEDAKFEFELDASGNKRFKFTMPNAGDSVDYCTAGTGGTDISGATYLNMTSGNATPSTPFYDAPHVFRIGKFQKQSTEAPDSRARSEHGMLSYDGKLWIIAGLVSGSLFTQEVWYSSDDGVSWTRATASAAFGHLRNFGCCVFDNKMWVVGGESGIGRQQGAYYSTNGVTWSAATTDGGASGVGDTWTARSYVSLVTDGTKMYLIGGIDATGELNEVYSSTDGVSWTQETADGGGGVWSARYYHSTAYYNGLLWIVGGYDGSNVLSDVYYSSDGATWTQATASAAFGKSMQGPLVVVGDTLYMMGGVNGNAVDFGQNNIWRTTDGETWERYNVAAWKARSNHAAVVHEGAVYVGNGKDAATDTRLSDMWKAEPSQLQVPYSTSSGTHAFETDYTHYRMYATLDIGVNGVDAVSGAGNNPELYIHLKDVPIIKSFVVTTDANQYVTASKGTFHDYDVGSILYLDDGNYGTITDYISASKVKWSKDDVYTSYGATIGTQTSFVFSQSGTTVTATRGTPFSANDKGKRIFVSDGTVKIITEYTDSTHVEVADSETLTGYGGGMLAYSTTDATQNSRKFSDRTTEDELRIRAAQWILKNRLWEPLPNCELGTLIPGFMISAERDGDKIHMTDLSEPYLAGYYYSRDGWQVNEIEDTIKALRTYESKVAAFCVNSTIVWDGEIVGVQETPQIAERIRYLSQRRVIRGVGAVDGLSICETYTSGVDVVVTTQGEIRMFDGAEYGDNLAQNMMTSKMKALQLLGAASCDARTGYYRWSTDDALTNSRVPFPDVCYNFAIDKSQGAFGGISVTGNDWVRPPDGINGYAIVDGNGYERQVVWDNKEGRLYEISTYDGPSGSGLSRRFVDKYDGSSGTEILASLWFAGDTGELPHYDIRHESSLLTLMPDNPANGGSDGYDTEGFRDGLEIDLSFYRKSNWDTAYATVDNVDRDHEITIDETPRDKAHQVELTVNRSEVILGELINYYTAIDEAPPPDKRDMTEGDHQLALATSMVLWLTRNETLYRNMVTGTSISGTAVGVTGVDDKSNSGFQITENLSTITVNLSSGAILFWHVGTIAITIGGNAVALSTHGTHNGWTLSYAQGVTESGVLVLVPTGTVKIEDLRVRNAAISDNVRTYYYNDMVNNNGKNTLPAW